MRAQGFTLLETLGVLAVMAAIITLSIGRFQRYEETMNSQTIKTDVRLTFDALDVYYHQADCVNGVFPQVGQDLFAALNLQFSAAPPWVSAFHAYVMDTGMKTKVGDKPIYKLKVSAQMLTANSNRLAWLAKTLAASLDGQNLFWESMPNEGIAKLDNNLWVLDFERARFTKEQSFSDDHRCAH